MFADLELLEFKVPTICLVTGCVSLRRDRRYHNSGQQGSGTIAGVVVLMVGTQKLGRDGAQHKRDMRSITDHIVAT
jgi:hypothetical protein